MYTLLRLFSRLSEPTHPSYYQDGNSTLLCALVLTFLVTAWYTLVFLMFRASSFYMKRCGFESTKPLVLTKSCFLNQPLLLLPTVLSKHSHITSWKKKFCKSPSWDLFLFFEKPAAPSMIFFWKCICCFWNWCCGSWSSLLNSKCYFNSCFFQKKVLEIKDWRQKNHFFALQYQGWSYLLVFTLRYGFNLPLS